MDAPLTPDANRDRPDRDPQSGRLLPGNKVSRGPRSSRMSELRRAALESQSEADVIRVVNKMRELAEAGDSKAAKTYLDVVVGRPPQAVEISGADGEPLGIRLADVEMAVLTALQPFGDGARFQVAAALQRLSIHANRNGGPAGPEVGP